MIRILFIVSIFLGVVQAEAKRYFIQLGSFQRLSVLDNTINNLPVSLRSHIVVVRSNQWYIPFAYHSPDRPALERELSAYRRYFPDAFINDSDYILMHPVVRNYVQKIAQSQPQPQIQKPVRIYTSPQPNYQIPQRRQNVAISEEDFTMPELIIEKQAVALPTPTPVEERPNYFTNEMLSGHQYYLAYKKTENSPNLLIRATFETHQVTYQPIIGDMQLMVANYIVDDHKLYMYVNQFSREGAYSQIEEYRSDHILVSSWSKGKKLNTLRYYYDLNAAKAYLGEESSQDALSQALERQNKPWEIE
ncbi:MAG: hypothetical protein IE889_08925 [Campylobacterales bacterium]|nr:hypothetical protein [Campylobacterales bacterium]